MADRFPLTAPTIETAPAPNVPLPSTQFSTTPPNPASVATSTTSDVPVATPSSSSASLFATTSSTPAPSQVTANDPHTTSPGSSPNLGLAIGLTFGILGLLAIAVFLVRYMFIRHRRQHRESGQRLAYSKAKYAISAPTNFTVLESGTYSGNGATSPERPGTSMSIQPSIEDWGNGGSGERVGSPERMRERYPFEAMNGLESGLRDQMQTMKSAQLSSRKPVPVYTAEAETQ